MLGSGSKSDETVCVGERDASDIRGDGGVALGAPVSWGLFKGFLSGS